MYGLGIDDDASREHLRRQLLTIDVIDSLHSQISETPDPRSELVSLNSLAPDAPISLLDSVVAGLDTARDSLVHAQSIFVDGDKFALVGLQSLARAALLGAARVAFVLGPDDRAVREANTHIVLRQEAKSLLRALDATAKFEHLRGMVPTEEFTADMRARADALLKTDHHGEGRIIRLMAEEAGKQTVAKLGGEAPEPLVLVESLEWIWHSASGSAHAYGWPRIAGGDFVSDFGMVVPVVHIAMEAAVRSWRA
ncbi:hypothetical protein CH305_19385 [Rhodococcus sp. 15-649-2-2]|uniref:hypothetical protein n=1 Tax=Rhodococcus sp. 15-649-2-2 TaxID=2023140 RepID=UPI000B9C225C|nr:hypothetical protein [Rhodococcus sp. 15-649-2-2]OZE77368.1 hypothetical protein CH305_19385 [Rhodococcus sp. 15-649-2-2]